VRELLVVLLALALVGGVAFLVVGCGGGSDSDSSGEGKSGGGSASGDAVESSANAFLDKYVAEDGRVRRIDQGDDTVGEGQAYGMLLAAAIGDEDRFDSIWGWTKDNLVRPDGLISFLWANGKVTDPEPASDADVDAARALLVASCRFKRPELKDEALKLAAAILAQETADFQGSPVLVAGPWAAKRNPIVLNPSYFSPATFAALGTATGDGQWGSLSASARSVTELLMPSEGSLPPDWASVKGAKPVPIGTPDNPGGTPTFGFDAARTLVRFAEDPDPAGVRIAAKAWPAYEGQKPADIVVEHNIDGKPSGGTKHAMGLVAAAGAAQAAGKTSDAAKLLDAAEALDKQDPTYYGSAWVALGRVMLTSDLLNACG
jgi:endo-1,4-beta-D-glucanase Y